MYPHHSHHQSTTTFSSIYMTSAQAIFGRRCAPFSAPLTCCCVCVQYNAIAIWLYLPREFFMALYEAVTTVIFSYQRTRVVCIGKIAQVSTS